MYIITCNYKEVFLLFSLEGGLITRKLKILLQDVDQILYEQNGRGKYNQVSCKEYNRSTMENKTF